MRVKWGGGYVFNEPDVHAGIDIHAEPGDVVTVSEPMGHKLIDEGGGLWTKAEDDTVPVATAEPVEPVEPVEPESKSTKKK